MNPWYKPATEFYAVSALWEATGFVMHWKKTTNITVNPAVLACLDISKAWWSPFVHKVQAVFEMLNFSNEQDACRAVIFSSCT